MGTGSSTLNFAQGVKLIRNQPVPLDDHKTWKLIFASAVKPAELHAILDTRTIRWLRLYSTESLATLVYKCIDQILLFNTTPSSDATAVRTALLVLSRLLPFVIEELVELPAAPQKPTAAAGDAATSEEPELRQSPYAKDFARHLLVDGKTCNVSGSVFPPLDASMTLGTTMIRAMVAAAFIPGFTIGWKQSNSGTPPPHLPLLEPGLMWCGGVASAHAQVLHFDSSTIDNRLCIIRCITSALCAQAYRPNVLCRDFLRAVFIDPATPHSVTLAVSLFNVVGSYMPDSSIPYASHWVGNYEEFVIRSSQLLSLLLDDADWYSAEQLARVTITRLPPPPPPPAPLTGAAGQADAAAPVPMVPVTTNPTASAPAINGEAPATSEQQPEFDRSAATASQATTTAAGPTDGPDDDEAVGALALPNAATDGVPRHAYWETCGAFTPKEGLSVLLGIIRLASNNVTFRNVYLPGSKRWLGGIEFFVVLLHKMVTKSPSMRAAFLSDRKVIRSIIVPILDFAMGGVHDPHRAPQVKLAVNLIAHLSSARDFAVALNEPCSDWIPFKIDAFVGTYADLVLITLHAIFVTRHPWIRHQQYHIVAAINNVTPFMTSISPVAAVKMVGLLDHMSTLGWLQADMELHARLLHCVVMALASLLQYQYKGSVHLLYSLVRASKTVRKLVVIARDAQANLPHFLYRSEHIFALSQAVDAVEDDLSNAFKADPDLVPAAYLESTTLVGKLPAPHRLEVLQFPATPMEDAFIASWSWSLIYVFSYPQFLDVEAIRSFHVRRAL